MQVILLEDVKGLGKKGQVVKASDGHAKNFLFPKKLAAEATKANMAQLEQQKKNAETKLSREVAAAQVIADKIVGKPVTLTVKVGEGGKMFGSIGAKELAEAVQKQLSTPIDKKKIVMQTIKSTGTHTAQLKLHPQVSAEISFEVVGEK